MIYYSTGKSPYLPSRGRAVESNNPTTAEILLKKGSIVKTEEELGEIDSIQANPVTISEKSEIKEYKDAKGNIYTEEQINSMDKRTNLYKEITGKTIKK